MTAWLVTLLHPPRPGETCPIAAVTASSCAAATEIRVALADGEVVVLDEGKLQIYISGSATRYLDHAYDTAAWKPVKVHLF